MEQKEVLSWIRRAKLENWDGLDLSKNRISTLPPEIGEVKNLSVLDVSNTGLTELPREIGRLTNLKILNVSGNKLTSLPEEIEQLKNLMTLDISNNSLAYLPSEIGNFKELLSLNLSRNQFPTIPVEITRLAKLTFLDLRGNPLPIPPEILDKANQPNIILDYLMALSEQTEHFEGFLRRVDGAELPKSEEWQKRLTGRPINETKFLIVGQGSVGKTSIVQQILHGTFDQNQTKTDGISINQWAIEDMQHTISSILNGPSSIKLNIWDFGGQEIMHATHQFFLTKRSLYLLVLDARLTQEENRVEYWLKIIQSFGGEPPVLIVGNKTDQHPLDIDRTGLQKKYANIVGILETSAATGAGIEALKDEIAKQVNNLPHVRDLLPETWFTIKLRLEEFAKKKNFFTQDEYLGLCDANDVTDETSQHTLIGFLHDLGVVLHFQDDRRLAELGILNPLWVTNGVYKILNDKALFKNKGVLTLSLLDEILNTPDYPQNKRLFIVEMMRKFELCYDIDRDNFLIPDLLPKDEPENTNFNGVAAFEYQYPVLPSSVITRFIVRMNKNIHRNVLWRTGVVLKIGENTALVKADIEDRRISISIDGLEHTRRDALSAIRYQLDEIHDSIKGLNPQKRVPIPEALNAQPLDYDYLLQLERDGFDELPVKDGNRLVKIDVRKLLSGIESEAQRKQSAASITNIYVGGDVTGGNIISGNENEANINSTKAKKKRK